MSPPWMRMGGRFTIDTGPLRLGTATACLGRDPLEPVGGHQATAPWEVSTNG